MSPTDRSRQQRRQQQRQHQRRQQRSGRSPSTGSGSRPWILGLAALVVLGVLAVVVLGRGGSDSPDPGPAPTPDDAQGPVLRRDHWHAAYGIYVCDGFVPPIGDPTDPAGIHTHGDGIIHIHPFLSRAAGANARLGVFADAVGMRLTSTRLDIPGGRSLVEGRDDCDGKPGQVVVKVDGRVVNDDPGSIPLRDRSLITIGFVAAGSGDRLPPPPTASDIERLDPRTDQVRS